MDDRLVDPTLAGEGVGQAKFGFAVVGRARQGMPPQGFVVAPKRSLPGRAGHQQRRSPAALAADQASAAVGKAAASRATPQASAMESPMPGRYM